VKRTSRGLTRGVKASVPYIEPSGSFSPIPHFFLNKPSTTVVFIFAYYVGSVALMIS
jgi:hypothetical protein